MSQAYKHLGRVQDAIAQDQAIVKMGRENAPLQFVSALTELSGLYRSLGDIARADAYLKMYNDNYQYAPSSERADPYGGPYDQPVPAHPTPVVRPEEPGIHLARSREIAGDVQKMQIFPDSKGVGLLLLTATGTSLLYPVADGKSVRVTDAATSVMAGDITGYEPRKSAVTEKFPPDSFTDLVVDSGGRVRILKNDGTQHFEDVTAQAGLPTSLESCGAVFDYDHDGLLDMFFLPGTILRNRGNDTFEDKTAGSGVQPVPGGVVAAYLDYDNDNSMDLLVLRRGGHHSLYHSLREGKYEETTQATGFVGDADPDSVDVADVDHDGYMDVLVGTTTGVDLYRNRQGQKFERVRLLQFSPQDGLPPCYAVFADLDRTGHPDIVVLGGKKDAALSVFWNDGTGSFKYVPQAVAAGPAPQHPAGLLAGDFLHQHTFQLAALYDGKVELWENQVPPAGGWVEVVPRGQLDNRNGVGCKVEVKADTLYVKAEAHGAPILFGVGGVKKIDDIRILWPNGATNNAMSAAPDAVASLLQPEQSKSSCPFLYAWDGRHYRFITDLLGGSPLGLPYAPGKFLPIRDDEYVRLEGDWLQPRDGRYLLQLTEELVETTYLDRAQLLVVDHPAAVEIYPDEKLKPPPYWPFRIYRVPQRVYPVEATNQRGEDVRAALVERDGKYAAGPEPLGLPWLGLSRPYSMTLRFAPLPPAGKVRLYLHGWLKWSGATSNWLSSQNPDVPVFMPRLEVPDGRGGWKLAMDPMGCPSGKPKTMVVDVSDVLDRRRPVLRISSSLLVYWDEAFLGLGGDDVPITVQPLEAARADLAFRGYSAWMRTDLGLELFDHDRTSPYGTWSRLVGRYTKYGDVRPLLRDNDDRYVVFGGGDALTLAFDAPPPPPPGQSRTFILYLRGWDKDGDAHVRYGRTVEPLPFHAMSGYPYGPQEHYPDDPVHRRYLEEWQTREVTEADRWTTTRAISPQSLNDGRQQKVNPEDIGG